MQYRKGDYYHYFDLTPEETNRFFEPFDPEDREMQSYLYHQRHRFIKEDMYAWMEANIGEPSQDWMHQRIPGPSDCRRFCILDADKAMLFKLTWWSNASNSDAAA